MSDLSPNETFLILPPMSYNKTKQNKKQLRAFWTSEWQIRDDGVYCTVNIINHY